jgi:hypothetical protein
VLADLRRGLDELERMAVERVAQRGDVRALRSDEAPLELLLDERERGVLVQPAQADRLAVAPQRALGRAEHEDRLRCRGQQGLEVLALELDVVEQEECPRVRQVCGQLGGRRLDRALVGVEELEDPQQEVVDRLVTGSVVDDAVGERLLRLVRDVSQQSRLAESRSAEDLKRLAGRQRSRRELKLRGPAEQAGSPAREHAH